MTWSKNPRVREAQIRRYVDKELSIDWKKLWQKLHLKKLLKR